MGFTKLLGYGSKKQIAGRRAFLLYERLCAARPDEEREFWQGGKSIFIFFNPLLHDHRVRLWWREIWMSTDSVGTECHLAPTFQSWFAVTNLHVWLLTVRLRALPQPDAQNHIQGLIDHFFLDVEERIRAVLQPASTPNIDPTPDPSSSSSSTASPSSTLSFYTIANGRPDKK